MWDKSIPSRLRRLLLIICIFAFSFWLRMGPADKSRFQFTTDSAFHLRMVRSLLAQGTIPRQDPCYQLTPPRDPARINPPLPYYLAAWSYRGVRLLFPISLTGFLSGYCALVGSLAIFPFAWLLWRLTRREAAMISGTLVFAVMTPVLLRSSFHEFRFEPGSLGLMLAAIVAVLIWTGYPPSDPAPGRTRHPIPILAVTGLIFFVGAGYWRLFPAFASAAVAAWLLDGFWQRRPAACAQPCWAAAIGTLAAWPVYAYFRQGPVSHGLNLAPPVLLPLLAIALQQPVLTRLDMLLKGWRRWVVATILGLMSAVSAVFLSPVLRMRWTALVEPGPLPITTATLYARLVHELQPLPLEHLFQFQFFSYLPCIYLLLIFCWIFLPESRPATALPGLLLSIFALAGMLFVRFSPFMATFFLIHLATSISAAIHSCRRIQTRWQPLLIGLLILPAAAGYLAASRASLQQIAVSDPDRRACLTWLGEHTQPGAVVVSDWTYGYEIQYYSARRSVMDGYLEDDTNRRRIVQFLAALFSTDESDLAVFCQRYRAGYLLLDSSFLLPILERLKLPPKDWLSIDRDGTRTRIKVLPAGQRVNILKGLFFPERLNRFKPLVRRGNYVILSVINCQS